MKKFYLFAMIIFLFSLIAHAAFTEENITNDMAYNAAQDFVVDENGYAHFLYTKQFQFSGKTYHNLYYLYLPPKTGQRVKV